MVKFIPFAEIKSAVPIERVIEFSSLPLKKLGGSFRCECPVHKGGNRSLVVTPAEKDPKGDAGVFYCHASGEGGDRIGLLAHVRDTGQYTAVKALAEAFCPELLGGAEKTAPQKQGTVQKTVPKQEKEEQRSGGRGFQPLPYLQSDHDAVRALGFSPEIASALGIGFAPRGLHRGRIAIPLRQADGGIAGYVSFESGVKLPPKWHL